MDGVTRTEGTARSADEIVAAVRAIRSWFPYGIEDKIHMATGSLAAASWCLGLSTDGAPVTGQPQSPPHRELVKIELEVAMTVPLRHEGYFVALGVSDWCRWWLYDKGDRRYDPPWWQVVALPSIAATG